MNYSNANLKAIDQFGPMTLADDTMPCLGLQWSPMPIKGEDITAYRTNATVTINPTGASGSKLLITLTVARRLFAGTATTSLTFAISGAAAKVNWSGTSKNGLTSGTASAATLKDVVDLINQIPGFKAWAVNAPYAMSVNSAYFIALAATSIKTGTGIESFTEVLHRDVSEFVDANSDKVAWMRIGLPDINDRNAMRLVRVEGTATGVTNGVVKVYRDDVAEYGETQEVYLEKALGTTAVFTNYLDRTIENADTIRGPVLLEVRSDDVSVVRFTAHIMQDSIGG
jgi:hypothetical protein